MAWLGWTVALGVGAARAAGGRGMACHAALRSSFSGEEGKRHRASPPRGGGCVVNHLFLHWCHGGPGRHRFHRGWDSSLCVRVRWMRRQVVLDGKPGPPCRERALRRAWQPLKDGARCGGAARRFRNGRTVHIFKWTGTTCCHGLCGDDGLSWIVRVVDCYGLCGQQDNRLCHQGGGLEVRE